MIGSEEKAEETMAGWEWGLCNSPSMPPNPALPMEEVMMEEVTTDVTLAIQLELNSGTNMCLVLLENNENKHNRHLKEPYVMSPRLNVTWVISALYIIQAPSDLK